VSVRLALAFSVVLLALGVLVPTAATESTARTDAALGVSTFVFAGHQIAGIAVGSDEPIARVELFVPQGYTVDLGQPVGTRIGDVATVVTDVSGSSSAFANAELVVDDPAKYATDPPAQACAPGVHAAVWRASLTVLGHSLSLPIFLDAGGTGLPAGAGGAIRLCPSWPSLPGIAGGLTAPSFLLLVEDVFTLPSAPGRYTWSALVTPTVLGSLAPEPTGMFEVRSVVPHPHVLTLRARHYPKKKEVVLSRRLTAAGDPEPGVEISFAASDDAFEEVTFFGPVTTNASGEFAIRRRVEKTTQFTASVESSLGPCTAQSTAPGGCRSETVSPSLSASATVRVRKPTDPKLAVRVRDRALARRINLVLGDFPDGWQAFGGIGWPSCDGFTPDLSDLTATGEALSPVFFSEEAGAGVISRASLYLTERHARTAFGREARLDVARCYTDELADEGYTVLGVARLSFPRLGHETRAFRVVASDQDGVGYVDLVSFRRGRSVVHLFFSGIGEPLAIEKELAAKVAARARAG
jgi:hypothetical protein